MRVVWDMLSDEEKGEWKNEGKIEGEIKGKIETIQTIAFYRFQGGSERLTSLLTKLDDLELLEQTRRFAGTAPALADVEDYAGNLCRRRARGNLNLKNRRREFVGVLDGVDFRESDAEESPRKRRARSRISKICGLPQADRNILNDHRLQMETGRYVVIFTQNEDQIYD